MRKLAGPCFRAMRLMPILLREKPDLALSVCSRSQLIVASLGRIPSFYMGDYEFATGWALVQPTLLIVPEVISNSDIQMEPSRIRKYPGIKSRFPFWVPMRLSVLAGFPF
jgi:predicted glycosyltransferase